MNLLKVVMQSNSVELKLKGPMQILRVNRGSTQPNMITKEGVRGTQDFT